MKKKCKHKFIHIIESSKSLRQDDKKVYDWLIHKCAKCHVKSRGERLE